MERTRLIGHLIDHYVARDKFRFEARHLLSRQGMNTATAHLDTMFNGGDVDQRAVATAGRSLEKCKHETLDHLHDLLHQEPVLDGDEHVHTDEDTFRFIIEEEGDDPLSYL